MSQRNAANDPFVPFAPPLASAPKTSAPADLKVVPKAETASPFTPLQTPLSAHAHAAGQAAGKPVVTLQREGDRVTGIRIECACGQVIELACSY